MNEIGIDPKPKDEVEEKIESLLRATQIYSFDNKVTWRYSGLIVEPKGFEKALRELVALARKQ